MATIRLASRDSRSPRFVAQRGDLAAGVRFGPVAGRGGGGRRPARPWPGVPDRGELRPGRPRTPPRPGWPATRPAPPRRPALGCPGRRADRPASLSAALACLVLALTSSSSPFSRASSREVASSLLFSSRSCSAPVDDRRPVDLGELVGLVQPGERVAPLDGGAQRLLVLASARPRRSELGGQRRCLGQQRVELALVGPAEHVAAAVVDAEPVVLLVPPAAALDLPGLGDRPRHPAELRHRLDALVVGAPGQLVVPATRRTACP